jgi:hypothetical protein
MEEQFGTKAFSSFATYLSQGKVREGFLLTTKVVNIRSLEKGSKIDVRVHYSKSEKTYDGYSGMSEIVISGPLFE